MNSKEEFTIQMKTKVAEIEEILKRYLPEAEGYQKVIMEAMEYSLMAGGKRLRPMLMQETCRLFGEEPETLKPFMAALEMIHTYSLVHDDLPAMDNDEYRRGRKTTHIVYGEDMGILAGDALLNYAFETAFRAFEQSPEDSLKIGRALTVLGRKAGIYGMIGGQVIDVKETGHAVSKDVLDTIYELKTGALIECAMMIGAILGGASDAEIQSVEKIAHYVGVAFQIQDDILDVTSTEEVLGKPIHSDEKNQKTTYVTLLGIETARLDSVYIRQVHKDGKVLLVPEVDVETVDEEESEADGYEGAQALEYQVTVTAPNGTKTIWDDCPDEMEIENPQLWWPNGLGEQPLYQVQVDLKAGDKIVDTWCRKIGLRALTMHREKDQWGESFAHEVNGYQVFAMGADYIPEDNLLQRTSRERTRELLLQCKRANFNTVRVWGGGYYPEDWFFDLCDELGLMVWQDFMFACSVYELTPEFEANIRQEFIDNIKRLRHHASLALWCGNNEMEMFVKQGTWVTKPTEMRDYLFMYERIIPEVLSEYDPDTFYWPASPSSGGSFDEPNDPNRGDVHYWEVWHGNKPFSEYRKYFFRYASEFGFQSFPSVKTLETVTDDPKELNPFSYVMEKHQRNYGGNGKIAKYMQAAYRYPENFSDFVYASQLLQADGIRYGVEHYRRNRGRCMGAIYWQLNDCWPVISWSSIDYYGRWKALHYYAKRFFAPVMLSCEEQSWMTVEADMNRQHFEFEKSIRLNVTNETLDAHRVLVKWAVRKKDATILREEEQWLEVPALSAVWMDKVELPQIDCFNEYVSYEAWENDQIISQGTVIFSYPKYFHYLNPGLAVRVDGDEIVVKAEAYAKSVEIRNENDDLILEDNYFDMNAGEYRVKILDGKPDGPKVRSVYDI